MVIQSICTCPAAEADGRPDVSVCRTRCMGLLGETDVLPTCLPSRRNVTPLGSHSTVAVCHPV